TEILKVRRQGYAFVSQELELGLCSIAVPVRSATGQAVYGLNVSMRYSDDVQALARKKMLPPLHRAREAIESAMARAGWRPLRISRNARWLMVSSPRELEHRPVDMAGGCPPRA